MGCLAGQAGCDEEILRRERRETLGTRDPIERLTGHLALDRSEEAVLWANARAAVEVGLAAAEAGPGATPATITTSARRVDASSP